MKKDESEKVEQVLEAISILKDKKDEADSSEDVSKGVDLESIVKKLSAKRKATSSAKK